tara:strand:+ start:1515 stop:2642 length:1128 start_codon:yes stop_codon:yes gene_type:complete
LTTKIHKSIGAVDASFLKKINPQNNVYFSKTLLHSFEVSNPKIEMRYVCVSDHDNPQALALVQIVELSVDVILKNIKATALSRCLLSLLLWKEHIKIMFCGNVFLSGEYCLSFSEKTKREKAVKEIGRALDTISKSVKPLHAIFIKDFEKKALDYSQGFESFGFTNIKVEPNMLVHLKPEWKSFEDYKDALKSKYRIKANKADSKSQALEGRFMSKNDIESAQKALQNLYQNTIDNANFNAQVLNLKTYIELKSFYKDDFIVKGYFLDSEIVGFLSALKNRSHLDAHFIGLNYRLNKAHAIYPRILNDYVRIGIENKVSVINLGRTASEIKTTIGAVPLDLSCYIKHKSPFINALVRPFFRRIQIKSFKQHSPFK